MIRVLIVDTHNLVRVALETRLRSAVGLEIIGSTSEYEEAMQQARRLHPDIVLLETKAPKGIETLEALCQAIPQCAVIVLTSYPDSYEEDQSINLGAARYLLKTLNTKDLVCEIRAVARQLPSHITPPIPTTL